MAPTTGVAHLTSGGQLVQKLLYLRSSGRGVRLAGERTCFHRRCHARNARPYQTPRGAVVVRWGQPPVTEMTVDGTSRQRRGGGSHPPQETMPRAHGGSSQEQAAVPNHPRAAPSRAPRGVARQGAAGGEPRARCAATRRPGRGQVQGEGRRRAFAVESGAARGAGGEHGDPDGEARGGGERGRVTPPKMGGGGQRRGNCSPQDERLSGSALESEPATGWGRGTP